MHRAYEDIGAHGIAPGSKSDPFNLDFDRQFIELSDENMDIRTIQKNVYRATKKVCFNILSLLVGIILSFIWGLIMGVMQFALIWLIAPWAKTVKLYWTPFASVAGSLMDATFGSCLKNLSSKGATINVGNRKDNKKNDDAVIVSNMDNKMYGATDGPGTKQQADQQQEEIPPPSVYPNV